MRTTSSTQSILCPRAPGTRSIVAAIKCALNLKPCCLQVRRSLRMFRPCKNPIEAKVKSLEGEFSRFDQCRFGLVSKSSQKPVQKPTLFLSNMPSIRRVFHEKTCLQDHEHQAISGFEGGMRRSTWASFYPQPLSEALARAVMDQWKVDHP